MQHIQLSLWVFYRSHIRSSERWRKTKFIFLDILGSLVVFTYMFFLSGEAASAIYTCLLQLFYVDLAMRSTFEKNRWLAGDLLGASLPIMLFATIFYMPVSFQLHRR